MVKRTTVWLTASTLALGVIAGTAATIAKDTTVHANGPPGPSGPTRSAFSAPPQVRAQPGRSQHATVSTRKTAAQWCDSRT